MRLATDSAIHLAVRTERSGGFTRSSKRRASLPGIKLALFVAAAIYLSAHANVDAAEKGFAANSGLSTIDMPERPLSLVLLSPLVEQGVALGLAVVYDDPAT